MNASFRRFAILPILLIGLLAFQITETKAQGEFPVDDIVSTIETLVLNQDSEGLTKLYDLELHDSVYPIFSEFLSPQYTIESFDIYGYEYKVTEDESWLIDGKYSIESKGSNGNWSVSGLSINIVISESDDTYFISASNLTEVIQPVSLGDITEVLSNPIILVFGIIAVLAFLFWLWMLIDVARNQKEDKVMWILVVVVGQVLGAIIYFFVPRKKRLK